MKTFYPLIFFILIYQTLQAQCWQLVSAGIDHSVAVRPDGTLWAWGFNGSGQLGDGTLTARSAPVQIGTDTDWSTVSANGNHTLALKKDGSLWSWGDGFWGQIGDGSYGSIKKTPVKIGTASWKSISAGRAFSLAIKTDGTLWAWGDNYYGQLGTNGTVSFTPIQVGTATDWESVSGGGFHSLAIKTDHSLWAWGYNTEGQLGDGSLTEKKIPVKIGDGWKFVSAAVTHSLGLKTDGTLWEWGDNDMGEVGDGTFTDKSTPVQTGTSTWQSVAGGQSISMGVQSDGTFWTWGWDFGDFDPNTNKVSTPVRMGTASNWQSVTLGDIHVFAFTTNGTLWSWGDNNWGKLGDGTYLTRFEPAIISTPKPGGESIQYFCKPSTVADLIADGTNLKWFAAATGGVALAANTPLVDGTLYYASQTAGAGACESVERLEVQASINLTPTGTPTGPTAQIFCLAGKVENLTATGTDIKWYAQASGGMALDPSVALVNGSHYYAEQTSNFCASGSRLDVTATIVVAPAPTGLSAQSLCAGSRVNKLQATGQDITWYSPFLNGGPLPSSDPLVNGYHYYATQTLQGCESVNRLDVLVSLYANTTKQPGDPNPVAFEQLYNKEWVSANIKSDGSLWFWGWNGEGQMTNGTQADQTIPKAIQSPAKWKSVVPGGEHVVAVKSDGTLWAWGNNEYGQLGTGNATYNLTDILQVGTDNNWQRVTAGDYYTLAIKTDGTLWSWGNYRGGVLGNDSGEDQRTPKQVGPFTTWISVSANFVHVLGITEYGMLYSWGDNDAGQVGNGTKNTQYTPTYLNMGWKAASAGYRHSLAVREEGTLWAWGSNDSGVLGNGPQAGDVTTPTQVGTASDWETISAGKNHNLAIKTDGTLWAWGSNMFYQLGDGTTVDKSVPTQIGTDTDWKYIAAASVYSMAVKTDGTLWAWGINDVGQLGDGTKNTAKTPKLIALSSQTFCQGSTVADLSALGSNLTWYASATEYDPIDPATALTENGVYYGSQTVNTCESPTRLPVVVSLGPSQGPAPTGASTQSFCYGSKVEKLVATGSNIKWYAAPTGGMALPVTTPLVDAAHYYASQTTGSCESGVRLDVTVVLNASGVSTPTGSSTQTFCASATVGNLTATGSGIQWYDASNGGAPLASSLQLVSGKHYYASQTVGGCESSARLDVVCLLIATPAPTGKATQSFCSSAAISNLVATGAGIKWYDQVAGGSPLPLTTGLIDGQHYYASQTVSSCESVTRLDVVAIVSRNAPPQGNSTQSFCTGETLSSLSVIGSNIQWYDQPTGGAPLPASTALMNGQHYYASQTVNTCESLTRLDVAVSMSTTPQPTGNSRQTFCYGNSIANLIANGTALKWYATETGGAPLPSTTWLVNNGMYYATQTLAGCESTNRFSVGVVVNPIPSSPTGASSQLLDRDKTVGDIAASGTEINWYSSPADASTRVHRLPLSQALISGSTYYATQTVSGCESNSSLAVTVSIITGVEFDKHLLKYYPNPVKDMLQISFGQQMNNIVVVNAVGQAVLHKEINSSEATLDLGMLESGVYSLQLYFLTKTITLQIIKQ
jgi:alpha-tubulin suppressor-like RCC1 family protein